MKSASDNASFSNEHILQHTNFRQAQLQNRLNSYFQNRRSSKQHNNTCSSNRPASNQTMDFRILFTKPEVSHRPHQQQSNGIQNMDDLLNRKQQHPSKRQVQSQNALQKRQGKQSLSKKKLNLMEFKLQQLQQEVELQLQKKIDIYKQNEQIEKQIRKVEQDMKEVLANKKFEPDDFNYEILDLETSLRREKERNKNTKREIERLKEKRAASQQMQTEYSSNKYSSSKTSSEVERLKLELEKQRMNHQKLKQKFQKNEELQALSQQLKKLRKMVERQAVRRNR